MAGYAGLFPRKLKQPVASGLIFGLGLWFVAEELAMAVLKINDPPQDYSVPMHLNSLGEHFAYGVASTLVARALIAIH
jgi:putative Mn2+ efflux pump MntP